MGKKFVSTRVSGSNNGKVINNLKHNLRTVQTQNQHNNNKNLILYKDTFYDDMTFIKKIQKDLTQVFQEERELHNEIHMRENGNRKVRESTGSIANGLIYFSSEHLKEKLNNKELTNQDLLRISKEFVDDFEKSHNTKVYYLTLHLDEKTPHVQFQFRNFDENGKSLSHIMKQKENGSKLQDMVYEKFKRYGFERGIKKEITGNRHQETKHFHENEIKELEKTKKELLTFNNKILEDYKNQIKDLKIIRSQISNNENKDDNKMIYKDITDYQKHIRMLSNEIKEENQRINKITVGEFQNKTKKDIEKILKLGTENTFGNGSTFNIKDLKTKINHLLKDYSGLDIINERIQTIEKKHEVAITKMDLHYEELLQEQREITYKKRSIINNKNGEIEHLKTTSIDLEDKVDYLEDGIKQQNNRIEELDETIVDLKTTNTNQIEELKTLEVSKKLGEQYSRFIEQQDLSIDFIQFQQDEIPTIIEPTIINTPNEPIKEEKKEIKNGRRIK